jgi:hypothetical protein
MAKLSRATIGSLVIAVLAWFGTFFGAEQGFERWLARGTRTGFQAQVDSVAGLGQVLAMTASEGGTLHAALTIFVDSSYSRARYAAKLEKLGTTLRVTESLDRATSRTRIDITGPATPFDSVAAPLFRWGAGDRLLLVPMAPSPVPARLDAWELTVDAKEGGDNSRLAEIRAVLDVLLPIAWLAGGIAALMLAVGPALRREPPPPPLTPEAVVEAIIQSVTGEDDADTRRLRAVARLIQAGQDREAIIARVPLDMKEARERTAMLRTSAKLRSMLEAHIAYLTIVLARIPTGLRP